MKQPAEGSAKHAATPPARPFGVPTLTKASAVAKKKPAPSKHAAAFGAARSFGTVQAKAAAVSKHSSAKKPEPAVKKAGTTKDEAVKAKKKPTLSPHELVACCSAAALAAHLRLAGGSVTDEEMLALYFAVASGPDEGADMDTLLAYAYEHGFGGARPAYREVPHDPMRLQVVTVTLPEAEHAMVCREEWLTWDQWQPQSMFSSAVVDRAWEVSWL